MSVTDLKCEYLKNPLGVNTLHPRFGWKTSLSSIGYTKEDVYGFQLCHQFRKGKKNMIFGDRIKFPVIEYLVISAMRPIVNFGFEIGFVRDGCKHKAVKLPFTEESAVEFITEFIEIVL